jgi:hypothetical protein
MKRLILSLAAAAGLVAGGAASAQDVGLGTVLSQILGYPGAVAQGGYAPGYAPGTVYVDPYGRRIQVDRFGRHILLESGSAITRRNSPFDFSRARGLDQYGSYVDASGRRIMIESDGRHTPMNQIYQVRVDDMGRTIYSIADQPKFVEQGGQLMAVR